MISSIYSRIATPSIKRRRIWPKDDFYIDKERLRKERLSKERLSQERFSKEGLNKESLMNKEPKEKKSNN